MRPRQGEDRRGAHSPAGSSRSDTELLPKSRRVTPGRLLDAGFAFSYPAWPAAAGDLVRRVRSATGPRTRR
ncbi:DUF1731 domain-containing protein [Kitasatospora herbaricolor]|uniref:DUF1731 domain-containing protein n=1 Tax=Kitasatospora herbaricolor TaxID=68217 RepID=UPI0039A59FA2